MSLTELATAVGLLTAMLLTLTQLVKDQLGLKGWHVLAVSVGLGITVGALLAGGGVRELQALSLYPAWASGAVLGLIAGLTASGGKAVVTNLQENGARARAEAQAAVDAPVSEADAPEEWQAASLNDMAQTHPNWADAPPSQTVLDGPQPSFKQE